MTTIWSKRNWKCSSKLIPFKSDYRIYKFGLIFPIDSIKYWPLIFWWLPVYNLYPQIPVDTRNQQHRCSCNGRKPGFSKNRTSKNFNQQNIRVWLSGLLSQVFVDKISTCHLEHPQYRTLYLNQAVCNTTSGYMKLDGPSISRLITDRLSGSFICQRIQYKRVEGH